VKNFCRFSKKCADVRIPDGKEIRIEISNKDGTVTKDIIVPLRSLLIEGLDFGDGADKCYFAVFRS